MNIEAVRKKLRIDSVEGGKVLILNAPVPYIESLSDIGIETEFESGMNGMFDFVQVFAKERNELEELLSYCREAGKFDCLFWACYPKGTGKIKSDINRSVIWEALNNIGLKAVTQIAIDETWSAMRGRPESLY